MSDTPFARVDALRPISDFSDAMQQVSAHFTMYTKTVEVVRPWVQRQVGKEHFFPMPIDEVKAVANCAGLCVRTVNAFAESVYEFMRKNKTSRTFIIPHPSTHRSAQYSSGMFTVERSAETVVLRDQKGGVKTVKNPLIVSFGGLKPFYLDSRVDPKRVKFIILRPKLGKLGTPTVDKWEMLLFDVNHKYLADHTDAEIDTRWVGRM